MRPDRGRLIIYKGSKVHYTTGDTVRVIKTFGHVLGTFGRIPGSTLQELKRTIRLHNYIEISTKYKNVNFIDFEKNRCFNSVNGLKTWANIVAWKLAKPVTARTDGSRLGVLNTLPLEEEYDYAYVTLDSKLGSVKLRLEEPVI
jgi:hypothetical protein